MSNVVINFAERAEGARERRRRQEALVRQPGIKAVDRMVSAIREEYLDDSQAVDIRNITIEYLRQKGHEISELLAEDDRMRGALHPSKLRMATKNIFSLIDRSIEGRIKNELQDQCQACGRMAEEAIVAIAEYKSAIAKDLVAPDEALHILQWFRTYYNLELEDK